MMAGGNGFKVKDRRTFINQDDVAPEALDELSSEPEETSSDKPTYIQQLEERTRQAEEQLARYIRAYKHEVEEELDKTRERLEREAIKERERDRAALALDLLEVLDNFDRSLAALDSDPDVPAIKQGLALVRDQFYAALQRLGISIIEAENERFDPRIHEAAATATVTDPKQDGQVISVFKTGYRLGERVIRPAMVRVGRLDASPPDRPRNPGSKSP